MKILSIEEACSTLGTKSLSGLLDSLQDRLPHKLGPYSIPADSGAKCSLSKLLWDLLAPVSPILIYVTGWGIWPSAENFDLFNGYRRSLGENRHIKAAPVHLFEIADKSTFVSILSMALYFVWDAHVFNARGSLLITFSHDEWVEIETADLNTSSQFSSELESMELEPLRG